MNDTLYVGAKNYNNKHIGNSICGTYHLKDDDGNRITVQRNQLVNKAKLKENSYPVSFRAIYDSDKVQISNILGFSLTQNPMGTTQGLLEYLPYSEHNYSYSQSKTEVNRLFAWRGNYLFTLPKEIVLNISPSANYGHNNSCKVFATNLINDGTIDTYAKEDYYMLRLSANGRKKIGKNMSASLGLYGSTTRNKVYYTGSTIYDNDFSISYSGIDRKRVG